MLCCVVHPQMFPAGPRAGKAVYLPPEIYTQQPFLGRAADLWSVGIMLFLCLAGADYVPFKKPLESEPGFQWVISGRLRDLIRAWKLEAFFDDDAIDLLQHLLCPLATRYRSVEDVMRHPFLRREVQEMARLIAEEDADEAAQRARADALAKTNRELVKAELKQEEDRMKSGDSPR
jgi:serine/threonine protein kinase